MINGLHIRDISCTNDLIKINFTEDQNVNWFNGGFFKMETASFLLDFIFIDWIIIILFSKYSYLLLSIFVDFFEDCAFSLRIDVIVNSFFFKSVLEFFVFKRNVLFLFSNHYNVHGQRAVLYFSAALYIIDVQKNKKKINWKSLFDII